MSHSPVPLIVHLSSAAATHPGRGRTVNEDSLGLPDGIPAAVVARKGYLYVVADGVGGHQAGDVASQMAVEVIRQVYYDDPDLDVAASLRRAIEATNAEIHRQTQGPAYAGMGATLVAAAVRGNEMAVANVGDSRAYLLRRGVLQRLTYDHTWVAERVAAGFLTPQEATHHEMRHVVTRSLGTQPTVEPDVRSYQLLPGDRLLLCSDGLWESVTEPEIVHTLSRARPQAAATALVHRAVATGSPDDTTALAVAAGPVRAGVLGQVEQTLETVLASPQQRAMVIGMGAILIVALLICGITGRFPGGVAQITPTATTTEPTQMSPMATWLPATPTATPIPTATPATSADSPTVTLLPEPTAISTPVPSPAIRDGYCILPSTNLGVGRDFPANALDPTSCQQIQGLSIPVGADVRVPNESTSRNCSNYKIIEVKCGDQSCWIFTWRIGRRLSDGTCQPIPDWQSFFATPRQE